MREKKEFELLMGVTKCKRSESPLVFECVEMKKNILIGLPMVNNEEKSGTLLLDQG